MNEVTFLQNFKSIANAPEGVQRLRELVLQLAAAGRLVPRVANEGDSESLVARIYHERDRIANEGEVRFASPLPDVDTGSQSLAAPRHWRWVRLGNLTSKIGSGSTPRGGSKVYINDGIPFLRSQNIWNDGVRLDDVVFISAETHAKMRNTQVIPNDILLNITGASLGRCAIVPGDFDTANVSQHVTIIRPLLAEMRHFLQICLISPFGQGMIWGRQVGMAREGLSKKVLEQFEIPLPPLEEQKRIVAKVDELMRLCDRLEAQQQERKNLLPQLSRANHIRFAAEPTSANLKAIFHEPGASIPEDMRKSILTHAIEGRLTKDQYSSDKQTTRFTFETPFVLPKGWRWETLGNLVEFIGGSQPAKSQFRYAPQDGYTRLVQIRDFKSDEYQTYVPTPLAKRPFNEDDVMIGRYGPPVFQILRGLSGTYNVALMKAQPRNADIEKTFLYYLLQERRIHDKVVAESDRTAGQSGVRKPLLNAFVIGLPPIPEQRRIVATIERLFSMIDDLESHQRERHFIARDFSQAAIAAVTFREFPKDEQMKSPKTEVETVLRLTATRTEYSDAPLATLLSEHKAEGTAKVLWQLSGMRIDAFYRQLKTEMANGWIEEDRTKRSIKEVEVG